MNKKIINVKNNYLKSCFKGKVSITHATVVTYLIMGGLFANLSFGAITEGKATGTDSISIGKDSESKGEESVVVGTKSKVEGNKAIAIGKGNQSTKEAYDSILIGTRLYTKGPESVLIGRNSFIGDNYGSTGYGDLGNHSIVIGSNSKLYSVGQPNKVEHSIVIGSDSAGSGKNSVVIGHSVRSHRLNPSYGSAENVVAIGNEVSNAFTSAIAIGNKSFVGGTNAVAVGAESEAATTNKGVPAAAFGYKARGLAQNSLALGVNSITNGISSTAVGYMTRSEKGNGISLGTQAHSRGNLGIAIGNKAISEDYGNALAIGTESNALGQGSVSLGMKTITANGNSTALGANAKAIGSNSVALGVNALAGIDADQSTKIDTALAASRTAYYEYIKKLGAEEDALSQKNKNSRVIFEDVIGLAALYQRLDNTLIEKLKEAGVDKDAFEATLKNTFNGKVVYINGVNTLETTSIEKLTQMKDNLEKISKIAVKGRTEADEKLSDLVKMAKTLLEDKTNYDNSDTTYTAKKAETTTSKTAFDTANKAYVALLNGKSNTVAIGNSAIAKVESGVALGSESVSDIDKGVEGFKDYNSKEDTVARTNKYDGLTGVALTSKLSGVSIGTKDKTRQLHNLAAGKLDTDAVNVAQLKNVNLGFSGDTGNGDVRLFDQRLKLVGDDKFITTEASDKQVKFSAKNTTLENENGKIKTPDTDGLVTGKNLAETINNSYWSIATDKTKGANTTTGTERVKLGETVTFKAGENVTLDQNGKDITISVKDVVKVVDKKSDAADLFKAGNGLKVEVDTKDGSVKYELDLKPNLKADNTTSGEKPTKTDEELKNATTLSDVLNSGWNLQGNGEAKDFVRPYDTVNFVDGKNSKVSVSTNKEGTVSNVQVDLTGLPISYTNADGDKLVKVGDKYYKESDLEDKVYDAKTGKFKDKDGKVLDAQPVEATVAKVSLVNSNPGKDGKAGDPMVLDNIKSGLEKYTDGDKAKNSIVNLDSEVDGKKVADNTAATVGDLRNMGFVVSDGTNSSAIKNGSGLQFKGTGLAKVTLETDDKGNSVVNVNVDDAAIKGASEGANAGIASAMAVGNLPQISNITGHRFNIATAVGVHKNQTAVALGISGLNERGTIVYKASGALNTKGHVSFGMGIGYQFDKNDRVNNTERDRITQLEEQIKDIKSINDNYKKDNDELKNRQEMLNKVIEEDHKMIQELLKKLESLGKLK